MSDLFSKNSWYAIGGSTALEAGEVSPARLFGEERVVWRGEDGTSHVWHNQCIHRGMRLQYGFVDQNRLSCRYHGWRFGGDGKCAYIPAHPDMTPPDDFCVPAYRSVESGGLIWTTTGEPDDAPPDLSGFPDLTFCRSIVIDIDPAAVGKALSDLASSRAIAAGVTAVEASDEEALVVAIQPVDGEKTQLHILTASADTTAARHRASAWARRFRWQVENGMTAETAPQTAA
ncbi:MAG: nitrite reductase/ring-hydroxylating ferredoxin subunit [Paracoccaceae bacterium]|jgi:nitrite reductase/ring-hydroxylating ferredoxin subunit